MYAGMVDVLKVANGAEMSSVPEFVNLEELGLFAERRNYERRGITHLSNNTY